MKLLLKIAICDDEEVFGRYLKEIVGAFFYKRKVECEITVFCSGEEFVNQNMNMANYQIVFLDINMEELDGISTARRLRELCKDTFVIFVTAFINYALAGYEVDAIRYLLKNTKNFQESVNECIEAILEKMNYTVKIHKFSFKEGIRELSEEQIIYIESNLHELCFFCMENGIKSNYLDSTLNNIENILDSSEFVRIHQSYLVNMKYIKNMRQQKAVLVDGTEIPIAKSRYPEVRKQFADYKGKM